MTEDRRFRRLNRNEQERRAYMPRRNWIVVVLIIGIIAIWQLRGGGTSFDVAPDLRHFSRAEYDAARMLMTAGFAIVTTPAACQQKFDAFAGDEEKWESAVRAWNERHDSLMDKVLQISQSTGLSAARNREAVQNDALRLVETRLAQWRGHEKDECARFVLQMNDGIWDLPALPELPNMIATVVDAPADEKK